MNDIAVIIGSWKRQDNLPAILEAVQSQTIPPARIIVYHDGPDPLRETLPSVVETVVSSANRGVWPRMSYGLELEEEYLAIFDDDTIPGRKWFENCLDCMATQPALYGGNGVVFHEGSRQQRIYVGWSRPSDDITLCDIVGHAWFLRREWLQAYNMIPRLGTKRCGEDYHLSASLQMMFDLPTATPPHPPEDREYWSSLCGADLGSDENALWMAEGAEEEKAKTHQRYLNLGWRPLAKRHVAQSL